MRELKIITVGLEDLLSKVGGFWSAISGVGFIALNFFLYRYFLTNQIKNIIKDIDRTRALEEQEEEKHEHHHHQHEDGEKTEIDEEVRSK